MGTIRNTEPVIKYREAVLKFLKVQKAPVAQKDVQTAVPVPRRAERNNHAECSGLFGASGPCAQYHVAQA